MTCGDRDRIAKNLEQRHQEKPIARGVTSMGSIIEVFATEDGSTWTIVLSHPPARSCVISSGHGWREVKQVFGEES